MMNSEFVLMLVKSFWKSGPNINYHWIPCTFGKFARNDHFKTTLKLFYDWQETLELLEKRGGPDAFINIKYMIPTFESCIIRKL